MGAIAMEQQPHAREAAGEASAEDLLDPEVLTLQSDDRTIVSDLAPGIPRYRLGRGILAHHHSQDATIGSPLITFERATADPKPLFHLARAAEQHAPGATTFYLAPASPSAPGIIELRLPRPEPASSSTSQQPGIRAEAHLHLPMEQWDPRHPGPQAAALFSMRPRWLSTTELNYLDAGGQQLACEDRDGGAHRLVTTVPMPGRVRDWLVAVWCLRILREEEEASLPPVGAGRAGCAGAGGAATAAAATAAAGYAYAALRANAQAFGVRNGLRLPA